MQLVIGDLVMDLPAGRVHRAGREIFLTEQEFGLLRCLAEHAGRPMSRARLLDEVWDGRRPGANVVDVYVSYLRRKVDRGFDRPMIRTVRGVGYVLEDPPGS